MWYQADCGGIKVSDYLYVRGIGSALIDTFRGFSQSCHANATRRPVSTALPTRFSRASLCLRRIAGFLDFGHRQKF
jgi:hypothetical protein